MIAIGCDHAGLDLKLFLKGFLTHLKLPFKDCGCYDNKSIDYPDFGVIVARSVATGEAAKGILVCGSGLGMSIVANKVKGIRATLCNDVFSARLSREHNNSNILVMGGRIIGRDLAKEIVYIWLTTKYQAGRHQHRIDKITAIENGEY